MKKAKLLSFIMSAVMCASLMPVTAASAAADSSVIDVKFTEVPDVVEKEEKPIVFNLSSMRDYMMSSGSFYTNDNGIHGNRTFVTLEDGTGAMQLLYTPEQDIYRNYRTMLRPSGANYVTSDYKYIRVTYMTTDTVRGKLTLINNKGGAEAVLEANTARSAGEFVRTAPLDIASTGHMARFTEGMHCTFQYSGISEDCKFYIKEIALFTSRKQAYEYYGETVGYDPADYGTMYFGTDGNGELRLNEDWGKNEVNPETGTVDITYAPSSNHAIHYMAKLRFTDKNMIPASHRYMRVLYSASIPGGTSAASFYLTNDGAGDEKVLLKANLADTGGEFVLTDTANLTDGMINRFANTGQHCSFSINSKNQDEKYSIKAVYFFPSREAAEGFTVKDLAHSVTINGNDISKYRIVVEDGVSDNVMRSANKLVSHVEALTGIKLPVVTDDTPRGDYEIIVGRANREASDKVWKDFNLDTEDNRRFAATVVGDDLVITAGNAYGVEDAMKIILEDHLYYGSNIIPNELCVESNIAYAGLSKNMKPNGRSVVYTNVETPKVFTEDFDTDDGYFTEENGTSEWKYSGGRYTVSAEDTRAAYVHVYEANVDYTARLTCTRAGKKGDMALLLRYVAEEAYVKAGYDFEEGEWYIEYREGLDFYTFRVASAKATVTEGNTYTVRFVLDGKSAELYVDGNKVAFADNIRHFTPGRIGVTAKDADVAVDDVNAVLLSGEGTVMKGITHTNFEKYVEGNGASFYELNDGSIYLYIPGYSTYYRSFDSGKSWVKETQNIFGTSGYAQVLKLTSGEYIKVTTKTENGKGVFVSFTSTDEGKTWVEGGTFAPTVYKDTVAGASIMNDKITQAPGSGRVFFVVTYSTNGEYVEGVTNFCQYYYTDDKGKTWTKSETDSKDIEGLEGIYRYAESKIIECADGTLRVYTTWGGLFGCMHYSESTDGGKTWGPNVLMPEMYCPSSSYQIVRDPYADNDHTYYMVWVYAEAFSKPSINHRNRIALAKSTDGKNWEYLGDIWRWECANSHHTGALDLNQIVNPTIAVSKDAIFVSTGISEFLRPDGNAGTHGFQQHHMWVLERDALPEGKPMNRFTDVKAGAQYYNAVTFVTEKGLFNGTGENTFAPDTTMNRAMFVTVLGRLAGADTAKFTEPTFADVQAGQWYTPYVEWAAANGIVNGMGNGTYGINGDITVEQACTILYRFSEGKAGKASGVKLSDFADAEAVSDWAADGVRWAVENGVYTGKNGVIDPKAPASRALVAMMFYGYVNSVK